jgi:hypothetical protein
MAQLGNGIQGGIEALVHAIRGSMEVHSNHALILLDSENAFNSLSPRIALDAVKTQAPELGTAILCCSTTQTCLQGSLS